MIKTRQCLGSGDKCAQSYKCITHSELYVPNFIEAMRCDYVISKRRDSFIHKDRHLLDVGSVHDREQESVGDQRIVFTHHELLQALIH